MSIKEVIVIGAGISGCATALALAKRDIPVAILTSSYDERVYHAPFIQQDELKNKIDELQRNASKNLSCLRANEQLIEYGEKSINELLEEHYIVDRKGNVDIHRCLIEQLKQLPQVEWIANHSLLELITLHQHSLRKADIYKSPMCVGVSLFNHETQEVKRVLAKEIIIATGGATSLYPFSTHSKMVRGKGIVVAWRAGARLLKMDQIQFYPFGLFEKDKPCIPLPLELLDEGGQLVVKNHASLVIQVNRDRLAEQMYEIMLENQVEHLWLNLTMLNASELKSKYPTLDAHCLDRGFNIAKDLLPIVPVARYTCGGIAVDRYGQTNLQRLRAVGEAACTGLIDSFEDEAIGVLESLTWAYTCAEDISKKLSKFIYYFPDLRLNTISIQTENCLKEDWHFIHFIMWNYLGVKRDSARLKRARVFLNQLQNFNSTNLSTGLSINQIHLVFAIQMALLITDDAISNLQELNHLVEFSEDDQREDCESLEEVCKNSIIFDK